jgi:hypothetical protein
MTLLVTHRSRSTAPRVFVAPVVRELPNAPAAVGGTYPW